MGYEAVGSSIISFIRNLLAWLRRIGRAAGYMDGDARLPTDIATDGILYDFDRVANSLTWPYSFLLEPSGPEHGQPISLPGPHNEKPSEMKASGIVKQTSTAIALSEAPSYAGERTVHSVFVPTVLRGWRCIPEDFQNICERVNYEFQMCYLCSVLEPPSDDDIRQEILQAFWRIHRHRDGDTWRGKVQTPDNEKYSEVSFDMSFFNRQEHLLGPDCPSGPAWECYMRARARDSDEWSEIGRYQAKWNAETHQLDCKMAEDLDFQDVSQRDSCYLVAEALEELQGMDEEGEELPPPTPRFSLRSLEWRQPRYRTQWEILEKALVSFCGGKLETAEWLREEVRKTKAAKADKMEVDSARAEELDPLWAQAYEDLPLI
ncbi:hypothetical protein AC579_3932 [Pseudocercospora musae]|uniref:Uncharacterized protein n=1 Tax=Pseudocercospora musae TaxID=113226 RepID=A0A139IK99_9PEZI|nr:hypothetical protein AC579_3932 [Pseudocercospora musae]